MAEKRNDWSTKNFRHVLRNCWATTKEWKYLKAVGDVLKIHSRGYTWGSKRYCNKLDAAIKEMDKSFTQVIKNGWATPEEWKLLRALEAVVNIHNDGKCWDNKRAIGKLDEAIKKMGRNLKALGKTLKA